MAFVLDYVQWCISKSFQVRKSGNRRRRRRRRRRRYCCCSPFRSSFLSFFCSSRVAFRRTTPSWLCKRCAPFESNLLFSSDWRLLSYLLLLQMLFFSPRRGTGQTKKDSLGFTKGRKTCKFSFLLFLSFFLFLKWIFSSFSKLFLLPISSSFSDAAVHSIFLSLSASLFCFTGRSSGTCQRRRLPTGRTKEPKGR